MRAHVAAFTSDDRGATAIEYGLIVSLMTIVLVAGLVALGGSTDGLWGSLQTKIGGALQ